MPPPHQLHQQQLQSQQHHPSRPRGPPPFQEHGRPLAQQPLQPLIPPHMAHRSPPLRPQMEPPPRMMSSPPPNFPQHHQQQPPQPKNIHINPHFRGPTSSSVQGRVIQYHSRSFLFVLKEFPLTSTVFMDSPLCCRVNCITSDFSHLSAVNQAYLIVHNFPQQMTRMRLNHVMSCAKYMRETVKCLRENVCCVDFWDSKVMSGHIIYK